MTALQPFGLFLTFRKLQTLQTRLSTFLSSSNLSNDCYIPSKYARRSNADTNTMADNGKLRSPSIHPCLYMHLPPPSSHPPKAIISSRSLSACHHHTIQHSTYRLTEDPQRLRTHTRATGRRPRQGSRRTGSPALQVGPDDRRPRHHHHRAGQPEGAGPRGGHPKDQAEGRRQGPGTHHRCALVTSLAC